jgi:hypothetical protein
MRKDIGKTHPEMRTWATQLLDLFCAIVKYGPTGLKLV